MWRNCLFRKLEDISTVINLGFYQQLQRMQGKNILCAYVPFVWKKTFMGNDSLQET